jgi:monofunctional biosynthetic peptidoglycan transglycosylase
LASVAARTIAVTLLAALLLGVGLVLPLRWFAPPWTAMMLEQPGGLSRLHYTWVGRDSIAVTAARAVIAAEDQKFLAHRGFDFESINRALDDHLAGEALRGASTISQQVAKNLFLWPGRSLVRKGLEAYFTVLLETFCSKERILEVYLNVAELGPGVFGVEAAARRYFGVGAATLTAPQAALLAAVLPNPRQLRADKPSAYVRGRQAWVLAQMRLLDTRGHYRGLAW